MLRKRTAFSPLAAPANRVEALTGFGFEMQRGVDICAGFLLLDPLGILSL